MLFLDELPEFRRDALEALRQPLEEGRVLIARAHHSVELPCRFQLVAAANPCPCGRGDESPECQCPAASVRRYATKLSGALADRIDLSLRVSQPDAATLRGPPGESSAVGSPARAVRARAPARPPRARRRQRRHDPERDAAPLRRSSRRPSGCCATGSQRFGLSGRGYERVLRVARTFADLAGRERIGVDDLGEALTLRRRERE